ATPSPREASRGRCEPPRLCTCTRRGRSVGGLRARGWSRRRARWHGWQGQGSSWFPIHICGVKPTVSEELPFNQQVCGGEAKHTLHTCETPHSYCRTSVVPTQSASIRTGVDEWVVFQTWIYMEITHCRSML